MDTKSEKLRIIDRDTLKYIAAIPMAVGHFVGFVWSEATNPGDSVLRFVLTQMSLIAPPIFFFFIAEGFRYTRSPKKYALRLLVFAVISQIPFCLSTNGTLLTTDLFLYLNVFFTLFLGLVSLIICESGLKKPVKILLVILMDALTVIFGSQWMLFGIPIILSFYYFKDKPIVRLICFGSCACMMLFITVVSFEPILGLEYFLTDLFFLMLGYAIATVFYNGNKGSHPRFSKWFFYIFYPVHLLVIYAAEIYVGRF